MEGFAQELRRQCERKGTIAQLCKATGINRQQFNKYLAGQILPGSRTMRKICSYLGVAEEQLMSGRGAPVELKSRSGDFEIDYQVGAATRGALDPSLHNGFYRAYFPVRGRPDLVACWLVHVASMPNGKQAHTCRIRLEDGVSLGFAGNRITYRGPVTYGPGEAGLIGTAKMPKLLHGIIFVNLRPVVGQGYFSAMVLTSRADGPLALSGVLQFLGPGYTARRALAGIGVARLDDPAMDPVIVQMMNATPAAGSNWMHSITDKNLRDDPGGPDPT